MQDSETGRRGVEFGYESAERVAQVLGARPLEGVLGNLFTVDGQRVVIKSARKATMYIGITHKMLPTLQAAYAALEEDNGHFSVYKLDRHFLDRYRVVPGGRSKETQVFFRAVDIRKYGVKVADVEAPATNYWVTTQWPHRIDCDKDTPRESVHLIEGNQSVGADLRPGDLVAVYESQKGRTEVRESLDGNVEKIKTHIGREGVVALIRVTTPLLKNPDAKPQKYTDGKTMWWRWYAEAEPYSTSGYMSRGDLNEVLGLDRNYNMFGFGDRHSGLKKIAKVQFERIAKTFEEAGALPEMRSALRNTKYVRGGGGVEGPIHKLIKESVAADPARMLGEAGLRTIEMEFSFPTGDSADILLQDAAGKIIGLEVEPTVGDNDLPGILQAIKYRYMGALMRNKRYSDSRAFLVAGSISPSARRICDAYDVECFEVDPKKLLKL